MVTGLHVHSDDPPPSFWAKMVPAPPAGSGRRPAGRAFGRGDAARPSTSTSYSLASTSSLMALPCPQRAGQLHQEGPLVDIDGDDIALLRRADSVLPIADGDGIAARLDLELLALDGQLQGLPPQQPLAPGQSPRAPGSVLCCRWCRLGRLMVMR